jgi:hypothetical protein
MRKGSYIMSIRKVLLMAVTMTALLCVNGWAQPGRGRGGPRDRHDGPEFRPERHVFEHPPVGSRHIIIGGHPYWVHGGVYYEFGDDGYVVVGAPVVRVLPRYYHVVVIHGVVYYVADDVYYRPTPEGAYIVVDKPAEPGTPVAAVPAQAEPMTVTLYVPKKAGDGFTPVILKRIDGGFMGPQGEFYPTMPPVSLLTEMYGIPEYLQETRANNYFIHVPNKDGQTYTRVELTRRNGGFVGPQGEFYPSMPSVAHLAEMYGVSADKEPPVPAQEAPAVPANATDAEIHVQVSKKNGQGTVDVVLKRHDNGYLGPQGEFYPQMPSPSQLSEVYGAQ